MPVSYRIDKNRRLVWSTAWGVFSYDDVVAHKDRLLSDPDFDPGYSQIADLTQVTRLKLTTTEVEAFAQFQVFSPGSRRALVASDDGLFGLGRMFATLRDIRGESGIGVFRSIDDALEWISG